MSDQALAVAVAQARIRDASVDEIEGRRRSRVAFRKWFAERPIPEGLRATLDLPILIDRHRQYWLGSAAGLIRSLDPAGLGRRSFHVVDAYDLGLRSDRIAGFHIPKLWSLARGLLPVSAAPGPTVAVNLPEILRQSLEVDDTIQEYQTREIVRLAVSAVAIHEAGHALESEIDDPGGIADADLEKLSIATVRKVFAEVKNRPDQKRLVEHHGPTWIRAAAHLTGRAARLPGGDWLEHYLKLTLRPLTRANPDDIIDALSLEVAQAVDEPIVDILRRDPPVAFSKLLTRGAA